MASAGSSCLPIRERIFSTGRANFARLWRSPGRRMGCSLLGDSLFVCDRLEDIGLTTPPEDLRPFSIVAGPRIGIDYAEEAVDFPWRYLIGP